MGLKEIWKEICGYDGDYMISDLGRIKSLKFGKERILKQNKDGNGYYSISLYKNGKNTTKFIHVLIYSTFIKEIPEGYVIHHKDENQLNNCLDNLQLMARSEHICLHHKGNRHSQKTKQLMSEKKKGENHPMYGKQHSEKTKQLMSEKRIGENHPMYGKNHSEKTRKLMSESKKGENHPMYGVHRYGENNPNSKLTDEDVRKIRSLLNSGIKIKQSLIAKWYGVAPSVISAIKNNKSWR